MSGISDEILMAYVDGELDGSARATVETYLATVPGADERLRIFSATGRGLSDLFDQPMREPVPQRLLDAVNVTGEVIAFDPAQRGRQKLNSSALPIALAASLTFLAAAGGAYWFASKRLLGANGGIGIEIASSGERIATHTVATVLDTVASGTAAPSLIDGQGFTVKPIYSFATVGKVFCRQFVVTSQDAAAFGAVACKSPDGSWRVEAHEAFDAAKTSGQKIAPAAGKAGPKSVEDAVDRLIDGDVLGAEAERALMARGWRSGNGDN